MNNESIENSKVIWQTVEKWTFLKVRPDEQGVRGSNPRWCTNKPQNFNDSEVFFFTETLQKLKITKI